MHIPLEDPCLLVLSIVTALEERMSFTKLARPSRDFQLQNVEIIAGDISTFDMEASFDRIFSIEMFEVHRILAIFQYRSRGINKCLSRLMRFLCSIETAYEKLSGSS